MSTFASKILVDCNYVIYFDTLAIIKLCSALKISPVVLLYCMELISHTNICIIYWVVNTVNKTVLGVDNAKLGICYWRPSETQG